MKNGIPERSDAKFLKELYMQAEPINFSGSVFKLNTVLAAEEVASIYMIHKFINDYLDKEEDDRK